jgi:hypothetical protein
MYELAITSIAEHLVLKSARHMQAAPHALDEVLNAEGLPRHEFLAQDGENLGPMAVLQSLVSNLQCAGHSGIGGHS